MGKDTEQLTISQKHYFLKKLKLFLIGHVFIVKRKIRVEVVL